MTQNFTIQAPAKINLRLDVVKRRHDGYHDLRMLNAFVSLYDVITIETNERGITVDCVGDPHVPSGEENLVYKAAKEIMAYSNKNVGIHIKIQKNIPSAAGLGGGSSDAAFVIAGLNQMLKINLSRDKLMRIGLRFGSDIPFFMYGSPAIVTGIGDQVEKVKKMPKLPLLLVVPDARIETKAVYEKYQVDAHRAPLEELPFEFGAKKLVAKVLHNDLESVAVRQCPAILDIKKILIEQGALGASMSGSGPSVFGVFQEEDKMAKALKKIQTVGGDQWKVFAVETLEVSNEKNAGPEKKRNK